MPSFAAFLSFNFPMKPGFHTNTKRTVNYTCNREELQAKLKQVWDASADLELEYGTIVSPTVIPYEEFEKYKDDLSYYRNIQSEGVKVYG